MANNLRFDKFKNQKNHRKPNRVISMKMCPAMSDVDVGNGDVDLQYLPFGHRMLVNVNVWSLSPSCFVSARAWVSVCLTGGFRNRLNWTASHFTCPVYTRHRISSGLRVCTYALWPLPPLPVDDAWGTGSCASSSTVKQIASSLHRHRPFAHQFLYVPIWRDGSVGSVEPVT